MNLAREALRLVQKEFQDGLVQSIFFSDGSICAVLYRLHVFFSVCPGGNPAYPEYPDAVYLIGREYRRIGKNDDAFSLYQQTLQLPTCHNAVVIHQGIIEILLEKGQIAEAESRIEALFSDYSDQADAFTRSIYPILNRYVYQKEYEKAVEVGRRALGLYPWHGNAFSTWTVMAEALVRMKQVAQADALVEEMFDLYRDREDFVPFMHTVKSAYWKAGQREKSQVLYRRLLDEFPNHLLATRLLGNWICGALVLEQEDVGV